MARISPLIGWVSLGLSWAWLFGCGGELGGEGSPCEAHDDCRGGFICQDGACRSVVDGDADGDADADGDSDGDGDADGDGDSDADQEPCPVECGALCCEEGQRCFDELCIPDHGTCAAEESCQDDTLCVEGVCVPFGVGDVGEWDATCSREPEPLEAFIPEIQCEWPPPAEATAAHSVRVPPLVADLDGDEVPEIIFADQAYVRAISGLDCSPVWASSQPHDSNNDLALGDLTGDGLPEVCGRSGAPFCLNPDGTFLWQGHDDVGSPVTVTGRNQVGISIVNVDGLGDPEVVVGLAVFDGPSGLLLRSRETPVNGAWAWTGIIPALADVDGDGHVEALTGGLIYDLVDEEVIDWGRPHGSTAVAELSTEHPGPEVVVISSDTSTVRVHALDGTVLFEMSTPGGHGGAPTVADLDGDGQAEFSTAGHERLTAFDLDCMGTAEDPPDPDRCVNPEAMNGVMWSVATHEFSSGVTGSSVFDFEGDGAVEIVYADECWARVFDGATGAVKFSAPHESGTGIEYPVVADVDGDFYTEIVVTHEVYGGAGCPATDPLFPEATRDTSRTYAGITVYRDRDDRWAPSRPLWSQHAEHWSNRNDDGTIPLVEEPSWETHNSYRQALPAAGGTAIDSPDLTVGGLEAPDCQREEAIQPLSARVCNRGTLPVAAGVPVRFLASSLEGEVICEVSTEEDLHPGECATVGCDWVGVPIEEDVDVFVVVDPTEGEDPGLAECHEDNNQASGEVRCPPGLI